MRMRPPESRATPRVVTIDDSASNSSNGNRESRSSYYVSSEAHNGIDPPPSNSTSENGETLSSYHIGVESDEDMFLSIDKRRAGDRTGESFHVVSGLRKHRGGRRGALKKIEIRPALKATAFRILRPRKKLGESKYMPSLDALVRHGAKGTVLGPPEASIPLPESDSERSSGYESGTPYWAFVKRKRRSSLDAIIQMGNISHGSKASPTMVPLPPSRSSSILGAIIKPSPQHFKYPDMIRRASQVFNHFDKVLNGAPSRNNNIANITSIDFFESSRSTPTEFLVDSNDSHNMRMLGSMGQIPANVKQRLLIVPDLAPQIINLLGNLFGFSPEVFEEHLINSGYKGAKYDDKPAHTWPTAKMKKSYASIKWYRPVQRLDEAPFSNRDLEVLLDPAQGRLRCAPDSAKDKSMCQTQSNIFRSEWEMWTDPKTTTRDKRTSAWEERATVWSQKLDDRDCYIVILILDPLPVIEVGTERVVEAARVYHPKKNFFDSDASGDDASVNSTEDIQHLWKLADRLQSRKPPQKPVTQLQKMLQARGKDGRQDDEAASVLSQSFEMVKVKVLQPTYTHLVFRQVIPRTRIEVGLDEAFRSASTLIKLGAQLTQTTSTKDEFCQWLDSMPHMGGDKPHFTLITPLYYIIQQDTINLLSYLHKTLDEINLDMLSDAKMEDRVVMWRQIIARAQLELPELKRSIATFFDFTELLDPREEYGVWREFKELSAGVEDMIKRLQIASSSLTSNMALLDSRRSIAEAKAVTKLTELAFFFIPLTFAATLFGMQVEQLATPAPISTFFALGIGFVTFSYLVRLIIRSALLHSLIKAYKESIAIYAQNKRQPLKQGNVPASMFLRWVGHMVAHGVAVGFQASMKSLSSRLGKYIVAACAAVLVAIPLAIIWTRPLAAGIKAAVTAVIVLLFVIVVIYNVMWRLLFRGRDVDGSFYGSDVDSGL